MEIKILNTSDCVCDRHIVVAITSEGGTYNLEDGVTLTVAGNRYHLKGNKVVRNYRTNELENVVLDEIGIFARKIWKVWAQQQTGQDSTAFQPIATFDTLEEAYTAATKEIQLPDWKFTNDRNLPFEVRYAEERRWREEFNKLNPATVYDYYSQSYVSPSKSRDGFFVQEAWI